MKGFVNNMAEFMSACDCVITKAGPGTIAEALICGMPILLNGYIPCQEEGNVSFVLENGEAKSLLYHSFSHAHHVKLLKPPPLTRRKLFQRRLSPPPPSELEVYVTIPDPRPDIQ